MCSTRDKPLGLPFILAEQSQFSAEPFIHGEQSQFSAKPFIHAEQSQFSAKPFIHAEQSQFSAEPLMCGSKHIAESSTCTSRVRVCSYGSGC